MKPTRLVQALTRPTGLWSALAFGGAGGGFSKEAKERLKDIVGFYYMESAEYEWGAVPQSLSRIIEDIDVYTACRIPSERGTVYYFCRESDQADVYERIKRLWFNSTEFPGELRLREPIESGNPQLIGWLELDNDFFFCLDQDIFQGLIGFLRECTVKGQHHEETTGRDP